MDTRSTLISDFIKDNDMERPLPYDTYWNVIHFFSRDKPYLDDEFVAMWERHISFRGFKVKQGPFHASKMFRFR